jgi:sporulation protein YlmC with PRC-barrel domain
MLVLRIGKEPTSDCFQVRNRARTRGDEISGAAMGLGTLTRRRHSLLARGRSIHSFEGDLKMTTASGHTTAIRAKRVIGTTVKDQAGEKIGEVEDVVLDKTSNNIMFGVVSFGGVLGMGEKYHPVPWSSLSYDKDEGAYIVNMTKDQLKSAPADSIDELTRDDGIAYRDRAYDYYKAPRYWK